MKVIFEPNSREKLLTHLGFNAEAVANEVDQHIAKQGKTRELEGDVPGNRETAETDAVLKNNVVSATAPQNRVRSKDESEKLVVEKLIKRSLLVGKFSAAVKSCLQVDNMADALLLASCGGAELWASTQSEYFERHKGSSERSGYLGIVSAIVNSELRQFVETSNLSTWKETLAILRCVVGILVVFILSVCVWQHLFFSCYC